MGTRNAGQRSGSWSGFWTTLLSIALATGLVRPAAGLDASSNDPRAIMNAVFDRPTGDRVLSRLQMTIRDGSGTRVRTLTTRAKNSSGTSKSMMVLESPPDLRNTAFLGVDRSTADDEQWIYLPNLHRTTRIPRAGRSAPFLGSDFSYADLRQPNPGDYQLTLVEKSVVVDREECWLIDAVPKDEQVQEETGYMKTQLWVSKAKMMPVQIKAWIIKGHKTKYIKITDVRLVRGTWTPYQMQAKTVSGQSVESETALQVLSLQYDASEVTDADFTMQRLERGL